MLVRKLVVIAVSTLMFGGIAFAEKTSDGPLVGTAAKAGVGAKPGKHPSKTPPTTNKIEAPTPACPGGCEMVGPVESSGDFSRPCKKDKMNGTMICASKFVRCMCPSTEQPNHAYTEACGPCVVTNTTPAQQTTPTGN